MQMRAENGLYRPWTQLRFEIAVPAHNLPFVAFVNRASQ